MLGAVPDPGDGRRQDRILRVEPAEERDARDRQGADEHRVRRGRHLLEEPAQGRHLVGVNAVIHAAGAEEEQGLEAGVGEQVEEPRRTAADPQAQHHETELTDRRVREDLLVVGLDHRDRGRDEERDSPGVGDEEQGGRSEDGEEPPHQVHPGGHHRGRVDQGRDRRRPGHRVGEPHVERELGALADAAREDAQSRQRQEAIGDADGVLRVGPVVTVKLDEFLAVGSDLEIEFSRRSPEPLIDLREVEGTEGGPEDAEPHQHPHVADPVDDEGLVRRVAVRLVLVPEADQEVRANPDQLPEDEDHEDVRRSHEPEHREAEEREIREESRIPRVVVHVAHGIDVDERRDERDHQEHDGRQVVDVDANREGERLGGERVV